MNYLREKECTVCMEGAPQVTEQEHKEYMLQIPEWNIIDTNGIKKLQKKFKFKNFAEALKFTNEVGNLAEHTGHHPSILTEWGKVEIIWWTHKIKGLHLNDFIMASKTDELSKAFTGLGIS